MVKNFLFTGLAPGEAYQSPFSLTTSGIPAIVPGLSSSVALSEEEIKDHLKVQLLIRSYQVRNGTFMALIVM